MPLNLDKSISFNDFYELNQRYALEGKTSGSEQSEQFVEYTKLNMTRMKRIMKTTEVIDELAVLVKAIEEPITWLVITETWCGDSAQNLPVIAKIAELNPLISIRILFRDENPEVLDQYLTNGSRSIPKLVAFEYGDLQKVW